MTYAINPFAPVHILYINGNAKSEFPYEIIPSPTPFESWVRIRGDVVEYMRYPSSSWDSLQNSERMDKLAKLVIHNEEAVHIVISCN